MPVLRRLSLFLLLVVVALPSAASALPLGPTAPSTGQTDAPTSESDADAEEGIFFPVRLPLDAMDNTWGAPRSGGRSHAGTDILAPQMAPAYATVDGEIMRAKGEDCAEGQVCRDYYLAIAGDDGRGYLYIHLNDDTPDRPNGCDGLGGVEHAFAPRLVEELEERGTLEGVRVEAGEHIGYTGSSGNADCGVDHIHFEIWEAHDWGASGRVNPYDELVAAIDAGDTRHEVDDLGAPATRALLASQLAITMDQGMPSA